MNDIPALAWIAIIAIALITIAIYSLLFALVRNRAQLKDLGSRLQSRPPNRTVKTIRQIKEVMRDPFREEREQIGELSRLVSNLPKADSSMENPQGPPDSRD